MSATHTSALLNRVQRVVDRGTVWRADVGSLEPALVDRFTRTIVNRFPDVSAKYEPQPLETNATPASDLILAGTPTGPDLEAEPEEEMEAAEFSPRPTVAEMRAMWEARQGHSHPPSAIPDQAPRRIQRTRWPSEPEEETESVEPPARPTMAEMRAMWESKQAGSHQSPSISGRAPAQVQRVAAEPARGQQPPQGLPPGTRRFSRVEELSPGPRTSALRPAPIDVEQPQPQPESPPATTPARPVVQRQPAGEMPSPETPLPEEAAPGPETLTSPLAEPAPESPRPAASQEISSERPAVQRQPAEEVPAPEPPVREESAPGVEAPAPPLAEPAPEPPPRLVSREVLGESPAVQRQPAPEPAPLVEEAAPGAETPTPPLAEPAPEPLPRLVSREVSGEPPAVQRQATEEMPALEPTPLVEEEAASGAETPMPPVTEPAPEPPPRLVSREVSGEPPAVQRQPAEETPAPEPTPLVEEEAPGAETPTPPVVEPAPERQSRLVSREVSGEPPAVQRQPAEETPAREPTPLVEEEAAREAETPTPPRPAASREMSPERPGVQRQPGKEVPAPAASSPDEVSPGPEMPGPEPEPPPLALSQETSPGRPAVQRQPDGEMPTLAASLAEEVPAGAETPMLLASEPPRVPLSREASPGRPDVSPEPHPPAQQPRVQRRIEPDLQSGSTSEPEAGLEREILARAESGTRLPLSEPLRSTSRFEAEGRRFDVPERLVLPERRLPPRVQTKPPAQTTLLPQTRVQARFEDQATEAVSPSLELAPGRMDAGRVETGWSQVLGGELLLPPPPRASSAGLIQRQPSALAPDVAVPSQRVGVVQRAQEGGPAASASPVEEKPELELDHLARQIYPLIKRMLAVERERRPVR